MSIKPGKYRHYKDNDYLVLGTAIHTETGEEHVHYQALYGNQGFCIRPKTMFEETVTINNKETPRFKLIREIPSQNGCRPFHLAFPVANIEKARQFYTEILGCKEGRRDKTWVDLDLYGHQLVFHLNPNQKWDLFTNPVDDHAVPVPHFGVVLTMSDWKLLSERLKAEKIKFIIDPYIRFKGEPCEQATLFFLDPNGLALEFKAFQDDTSLFKT